jgi:hypothetical protein
MVCNDKMLVDTKSVFINKKAARENGFRNALIRWDMSTRRRRILIAREDWS